MLAAHMVTGDALDRPRPLREWYHLDSRRAQRAEPRDDRVPCAEQKRDESLARDAQSALLHGRQPERERCRHAASHQERTGGGEAKPQTHQQPGVGQACGGRRCLDGADGGVALAQKGQGGLQEEAVLPPRLGDGGRRHWQRAATGHAVRDCQAGRSG